MKVKADYTVRGETIYYRGYTAGRERFQSNLPHQDYNKAIDSVRNVSYDIDDSVFSFEAQLRSGKRIQVVDI